MSIDWKGTALISIAVIVLGYIFSGQTPEKIVSPSPEPVKAQPVDGREQGARDAFMQGCTSTGHTAYCACTWSYLRGRYSLDEVIDMGEQTNNVDELPQPMLDAVDACFDTY